MGCSLQLMVHELYEHEVGIGRCTMLGVRDLCRLSQRSSKGGMHCEAAEQDGRYVLGPPQKRSPASLRVGGGQTTT